MGCEQGRLRGFADPGRLFGEVRLPKILPHRGLRDPGAPGDRRDARPAPAQPSDIVDLVHADHFLSQPPVVETDATTTLGRTGMVGVPMLRPESFSRSFPKKQHDQIRKSDVIKHNYLGVDPPDTLEQPEDDGLPPGPAPPHAPHPPGAEVALVRLDLAGEGRPLLADLGYPRPEQSVAAVRGATAEAGRLSRRGGRHVGVERLRQLPELALEEMRFCDVPIPRSLSAAHGLIKESFQALN